MRGERLLFPRGQEEQRGINPDAAVVEVLLCNAVEEREAGTFSKEWRRNEWPQVAAAVHFSRNHFSEGRIMGENGGAKRHTFRGADRRGCER